MPGAAQMEKDSREIRDMRELLTALHYTWPWILTARQRAPPLLACTTAVRGSTPDQT